jgi:hypothetical protein
MWDQRYRGQHDSPHEHTSSRRPRRFPRSRLSLADNFHESQRYNEFPIPLLGGRARACSGKLKEIASVGIAGVVPCILRRTIDRSN